MSERRSWPELVGKPVDEAVQQIQNDDPNLHVEKLPEGSPVTRDFKLSRVRVFHDESGNVASEPIVG